MTKSGLDVLFTQEMNFNKIVGVTEKVAPTIVQIKYSHALEYLNNANLGAIFNDFQVNTYRILGYCRGDFFCHPDNLVEIYSFS
jgi:hypothetical protein